MKKKSINPITRVKKTEPSKNSGDWIIWAAWADRITFEEIYEKTGKSEKDVILFMRKNLKPSSFKKKKKRVNQKSIKHLKVFKQTRKKLKLKISRNDVDY